MAAASGEAGRVSLRGLASFEPPLYITVYDDEERHGYARIMLGRDFRSHTSDTDGPSLLGAHGVCRPEEDRTLVSLDWLSTRSETYAFFFFRGWRLAGGPRALPEVLCRMGRLMRTA